MKPTDEQVMEWLDKVYGPSQGKPWHESALIHARAFAALAYAAGAAAERERCIADCDSVDVIGADECIAAIRARSEE